MRWWFPAAPASRVAVLRAAVYLFVVFDILVLVNDVVPHAHAPDLYRPLLIPRTLHLPAPDPSWVVPLRAVLIGAALVAATGRLPRLAGWVVALGFLEWLFLGMSYGKVDHDQFAILVALFVLPTVGRRAWDDHTPDPLGGWALRCVQVAVVSTYLLSVWAKIDKGGWDWPTGATFYWAVERRGTFIGEHLTALPQLLVLAQWLVLVAEASAWLVFVLRGRARTALICFYLLFHLVTYATISIHFLPVVVCWLAFAPLEKVADRLRSILARLDSAGRAAAGQAAAVVRDESVHPVPQPAERREA